MKQYQKLNRQKRAEQLAGSCKVKKQANGDHWLVGSQTGHGSYKVVYGKGVQTCNCPDFLTHQVPCKHILAVALTRKRGLKLVE